MLQSWNQPRSRKLDPIPVENLRTRKQEIMPSSRWSPQLTRVPSAFDPRPKSLRTIDTKASEHLRCSLLALNKPCAFLHILVPDIDKVKHDHPYSLQQLQLYVSSDLYSFCDFCVYTPVDVAVERIYPSKEWEAKYIPELEDYFFKYMVPEIVNPFTGNGAFWHHARLN